MNEQQLEPYFFPVYFIGLWLVVTTVLGFASGWFSLQARYTSGDDVALLTLRARSGSMGIGVALNGILTLQACPSGLRISIWKIFAPFQRPILVPWKEIRATPSRSLFAPAVRLSFGLPAIGRLKIDARAWQRLREAAVEGNVRELPPATPHVSVEAMIEAMLFQWAVLTLGAGSFFYFGPRLLWGQADTTIAMSFGFPAVVFAIGTAVRFLRQA